MAYTPLELERPLAIDRIYSVHYFEYGPDYAFVGESHDFWELVYADKGEVYVTAGEEEKLLKKGQMIFHQPGSSTMCGPPAPARPTSSSSPLPATAPPWTSSVTGW